MFEALLPPIANVDIDLGQHELVDDVLNVDARIVVAQYLTSVYTTTPLGERAKAVDDAIQRVAGFASLGNPIADMEGASAGALPELGPFLPRWVKRLESAARDPLEALRDGREGRRRLVTPSMVALIQNAVPGIASDRAHHGAMRDAMHAAAEKRVEAILSHSRRRHYGHAATLAASCLTCAPTDSAKAISGWIFGLRQTYSRRHAFRDELTRALENLGLSSGA